jgi:dephospho-CoA kinase
LCPIFGHGTIFTPVATKVIGLTGGIGMGKSTAADLLEKRGVAVCDTDLLARQVVQPGQPALEEILAAFGRQVIGPDGCLRRDEVARMVFSDPARRQQLEAITHPRIRDLWRTQVESWRAEGRTRGVVVIPLLFETSAATHFDFVICVACSAASQRQRLAVRGWNEDEIERRITAQWPAQKKMDVSDYVVWTEAGVDVHEAQLRRILPD